MEEIIKQWTTVAETDGNSYGSGYGYGSGSGDGYGDGSGSGSGYGFGDGSGSGDGIKSFCGENVYIIDGIQTIVKRIKGNLAKGYILNSDFTKTKCYVVKSDGCFSHGETLKKAREALQNKLFERMDKDETISEFRKKFKPGVKYPGEDYFVWHHYLTGSCEMGRRSFVNDREIDLSDKFAPEEFIEICKDAYGGEIIKQLGELYK